MTTTIYTGFDSPASSAIRKATLLAEANKLHLWGCLNEEHAGYRFGHAADVFCPEHHARTMAQSQKMFAEAEELKREAEVI